MLSSLFILVPFLLPKSVSVIFLALATNIACFWDIETYLMTKVALVYDRPIMFSPKKKGIFPVNSWESNTTKKPATCLELVIIELI